LNGFLLAGFAPGITTSILSIPLNGFVKRKKVGGRVYLYAIHLSIPLNGFDNGGQAGGARVRAPLSIPLNGFLELELQYHP